jgi:hypothetical protein
MGGGWVTEAEKIADGISAQNFPCMDEIEKYCKEIPPGKGELLLCLSKRKPDLSATCSDKIEKQLVRMEEARQICKADMEKFCPGVEPGQGRLLKCMKPQLDKLTPACREKVEYYGSKAALPANPEKKGER